MGLGSGPALLIGALDGAPSNVQPLGEEAPMAKTPRQDFIFFNSSNRIGVIKPDGTGERYLAFDVPNQNLWQMRLPFPDGRRVVLVSQEPPRNPKARFDDKEGAAFARTHQWIYDVVSKRLTEIPVPSLMSVVALLPGEKRFLVCGAIDNVTQLYTINLDGTEPEEIYRGPGYAYGAALSPEGGRVAYHITNVPGRNGYEIYVVDIQSKQRILVASDPEYLNFGPQWSPDGEWILYQRCAHLTDPGHNRADLCLGRADGSKSRMLTTGQRQWFATSYGSPETRGGGSNLPQWSPDGRAVTYTRCLPGSRTAWEFRADRPDTDHFNRDYEPELARGGTQICLINPKTGAARAITHDAPPIWNWRTVWSPDSQRIVFARAAVGRPAELWIMEADGRNPRFLTRGLDSQGADFPHWVRLRPGNAG
jgi:TolB protein